MHSAPRTQRRRWSALGRLLAGTLGVSLGLFLYVRWLSLPWSLGAQTNQEVRVLERRLHERHQENAKLTQRLNYLDSPEGQESLARSRGYHRPEEQVYFEPQNTKAR
jgi:cell division protein FtsB